MENVLTFHFTGEMARFSCWKPYPEGCFRDVSMICEFEKTVFLCSKIVILTVCWWANRCLMYYNGFLRIRENAGFRTVLSIGREYRILMRPDCQNDNPAFCTYACGFLQVPKYLFYFAGALAAGEAWGTCREGLEGKLRVFAFNGKRNFERKWRIFGRQRSRCPAGVRTA